PPRPSSPSTSYPATWTGGAAAPGMGQAGPALTGVGSLVPAKPCSDSGRGVSGDQAAGWGGPGRLPTHPAQTCLPAAQTVTCCSTATPSVPDNPSPRSLRMVASSGQGGSAAAVGVVMAGILEPATWDRSLRGRHHVSSSPHLLRRSRHQQAFHLAAQQLEF